MKWIFKYRRSIDEIFAAYLQISKPKTRLFELSWLQPRQQISKQKLKIIHDNAPYVRNKTEIFTALLQTTTPDILCISEHGLKDYEISLCLIEGCTVVSYFCRKKKHKGGGIAVYSFKSILQWNGLQKSIEKTLEVHWYRTDRCREKVIITKLLHYTENLAVYYINVYTFNRFPSKGTGKLYFGIYVSTYAR
jgi:hypothetical protein